MIEKDLIQSLASDILNKKRIVFLIGSGMSLTSNRGLNDGIGDTKFFSEKFKDFLKKDYDLSKKAEYDSLIKEAKESENEYSFLAKKIIDSKPNKQGISEISQIFKTEILPILNLKGIDTNNNSNISYAIRNTNTCKKIKLNPGFEAFGKISKFFQKSTRIITANFDPFIEIALRKNEIDIYQFSYSYNLEHRNVFSPTKNEIVVEHYHGYFLYETAHNDLDQNNDNKDQFKEIIKETDSIYAFGFGGWKDAFTQAIIESINDTSNHCIFHWAFYSSEAQIKKRISLLEKGQFDLIKQLVDNKNCQSYYSIDTNKFFPSVLAKCREKIFEIFLEDYTTRKRAELQTKNINEVFNRSAFKVGKLNNRNRYLSKINISDYIINQVTKNEKSIIVCSKFGLGKTTILEKIFLEHTSYNFNYAIIINLSYHELSKILDASDSISNTILQELNSDTYKIEQSALLKIITDYLQKKKLILILDGIDESIFKDEELDQFRSKLTNLNYPIITSIRLEFHDFIDNSVDFDHWKYEAVEIIEWSVDIINEYLSSNNIKPQKTNKIRKLVNLNTRPLFVNLLVNLNRNSFRIVSDNIASLYYHTISDALDREIKSVYRSKGTKNQKFIKGLKREYFDLLNSIAISIYLEFQHYKYEENYISKPKVTFTDENIRLIVSKNKLLDYERTKKLFEKSTLNGIKVIKTIEIGNVEVYSFFHRSLFEYLVANGAAIKILRDKKCSEAWDVYQTDEVSEYFVQEIEREEVIKSEEKKNSFFNAFDIEFLDLRNLMQIHNISEDTLLNYKGNEKELYSFRNKIKNGDVIFKEQLIGYSERLEEVIYYIGKFQNFWTQLQKQRFSHYCKLLFYNARITFNDEVSKKTKPIIDPIYYRTSSITLSRLINNSFIFDYISYLFLDYLTTDKKYFFTQVKKDTRYYGKEQLSEKCLKAYNEILNIKDEAKLKPLQILKIFSLYISLWYDSSDKNKPPVVLLEEKKYKTIRKSYNKLKVHCETNSFKKMLEVLEGINYVLRDISFDVIIQNIDLEVELVKALNKRKDFNNDIFRIVNSSGDNLIFLEIDYYAGHIVIETKKQYYYDRKNQIINILKTNLEQEINSISIKYNTDFEIHSFPKGKKFETLFGEDDFNARIDCHEFINIIVKPIDFPKTGFFIDNRNIRQFIQKNSKGKNVLNLCSYTCTLGAIAKMSDAISVINIDKEKRFLDLGKDIYKKQTPEIAINDSEFINQDYESYFKNHLPNKKFDIIILDLPEIAPIPCNFKNTENTYKSINEKCMNLLTPGGILITSCCSHGFSRIRYQQIIEDLVKDNQFVIEDQYGLDKLEDHPVNINDPLSDYLKIYVIKKVK